MRYEYSSVITEHMLATAFRFSPDPIIITTLEDGRYIDISDSFTDVIGYRREEVIGHTAFDINFWLRLEDREETMSALVKHGTLRNFEIQYRNKAGQICAALISTELMNIDQQPYVVSVFKDITERRRLDDALRQSEAFNSSLLASSPNPIVVYNLDGSIRYANPALEKLSGFSAADIINKEFPHPWWTKEGTSKKRSIATTVCRRERGKQCLFRRRSGDLFWVEVNTVPVRHSHDCKYWVSTWVDITEQKRLRDNMQFYIAEITRAQEAERLRIARDLHDETIQSLASLCTDLDSIMISDELPSSSSAIETLGKLRARIGDVINEVRRFSRELRPGVLSRFGLAPSLGLLAESISDEKMQCELQIVGEEMRLQNESEVLLYRIAQEALYNAKKHSQGTELIVKIEFLTTSVRLTISDNGIGFKKPRLLSNLARSGKLGLLGIKERVHILDGRLLIDSKLGKGTTIRVAVDLTPENSNTLT